MIASEQLTNQLRIWQRAHRDLALWQIGRIEGRLGQYEEREDRERARLALMVERELGVLDPLPPTPADDDRA